MVLVSPGRWQRKAYPCSSKLEELSHIFESLQGAKRPINALLVVACTNDSE